MVFMKWKDEYSVGIKKMDTQHKRLISIINDFYEGVKSSEAKEKTIRNIFKRMIAYSHQHFRDEEEILAKNGYPKLSSQKLAHKIFLEKTEEMQKRVEMGETVFYLEIANFLKDWWDNHILLSDKRYAEFFKNK